MRYFDGWDRVLEDWETCLRLHLHHSEPHLLLLYLLLVLKKRLHRHYSLVVNFQLIKLLLKHSIGGLLLLELWLNNLLGAESSSNVASWERTLRLRGLVIEVDFCHLLLVGRWARRMVSCRARGLRLNWHVWAAHVLLVCLVVEVDWGLMWRDLGQIYLFRFQDSFLRNFAGKVLNWVRFRLLGLWHFLSWQRGQVRLLEDWFGWTWWLVVTGLVWIDGSLFGVLGITWGLMELGQFGLGFEVRVVMEGFKTLSWRQVILSDLLAIY